MKDVSALVRELGYRDSPNYVTSAQLRGGAAYSLASRRLIKTVNLHGTYVLRESPGSPPESSIPVVYVIDADSEEEARRVHKSVWNLNLVPFLIIRTPRSVRLCAGFRFDSSRPGSSQSEFQGLLETVKDWKDVLKQLADFHARHIDDGSLWLRQGRHVTPETRVDRTLLARLDHLNKELLKEGLSRRTAHALLGKYIFLRYLADRSLLTASRLEEWNLAPEAVFGRKANVTSVKRLFDKVDDWLNGSVFPVSFSGAGAPQDSHIRRVTSALLGDDPQGQMHLDFDAYDFSFIPIETLSTIYQKVLHAEGGGQELGAYYTPLPLVHFTLSEMEAIRPLDEHARIFDPACGSGAFLVQCYRRLIEQRIRETGGHIPPLEELKSILAKQVYGVDADEGACRMAQLSLVLTMLDYADPEDLKSRPDFKLPTLHGTNILHSDFFAPELEATLGGSGFDWIVGNPPWFPLNSKKPEHRAALDWIRKNRDRCPVTSNQIAEAFVWKTAPRLASGGVAGLLLPAMTLFKEQSDFRKGFFQAHRVYSVANFANLARYLFLDAGAGAMALFFSNEPVQETEIPVFSPLLANQPALLSANSREAWSLTVDQSEIQVIPRARVQEGDALPWKRAMWGSARDERLLSKLQQRFPSLREFLKKRGLTAAEGLALKSDEVRSGSDKTLRFPEIVGKQTFETKGLTGLHGIPMNSLSRIASPHVRKRGGLKVLKEELYKPPHVLVGGTGEFAIFSSEFELVPQSRQHVIGGQGAHSQVLKALALFLSSDFARYHRRFVTTQWGVRGGRSTLATLESLPTPLDTLSRRELLEWERLHTKFVAWSTHAATLTPHKRKRLLREDDQHASLVEKLNRMCSELLSLNTEEQYLVEDFVRVRSLLADGAPVEAVRPPQRQELDSYARVLKSNLDAFLDSELRYAHHLLVACDGVTGMVLLELVGKGSEQDAYHVIDDEAELASALKEMREQSSRVHGQWVYFSRNLQVHHGRRTLLLKPMQLFWWTRSQALLDADEIIAEMLLAEGDK